MAHYVLKKSYCSKEGGGGEYRVGISLYLLIKKINK